MTGLPLLDWTPALNSTVEPADYDALSAKQRAVLSRLQAGPATSRDLNEICFSYRQRLSELRDAGYNVVCARVPGRGTLTVYTLVTP